MAFLTCLVLVGCAVGPDSQTPSPPDVGSFLPGGRSDPASGDRVAGRTMLRGGEVPAAWWELFRSHSLDQLVQEGIAFNADLTAAEAAVRVAQANALAQRGALFPVVTGSFDALRQKTPAPLSPDVVSGNNPFSLYTAQVNVSYVLDVWGRTRRQIESADAQAEAQAFRREPVYLTLTSNIALAAIEEARLRGLIAATRRITGLQSELLGVLRHRQEEGQIGFFDGTSPGNARGGAQ